LTAELRALLTARQADGWDFDALMSLGVRLPSALDEAAIGWLADAPSVERLDMVCGLLGGLWSGRGPAAAPLRALLDASDGLPLDAQTAYDLAVTLLKALRADLPEPVRGRASARLAALKAEGVSDPTLQRLLQGLPDVP